MPRSGPPHAVEINATCDDLTYVYGIPGRYSVYKAGFYKAFSERLEDQQKISGHTINFGTRLETWEADISPKS